MRSQPIGIIAALHWELADLLRQVQVQRQLTVGTQCLWEGDCCGRPVVVAESGVGRLRAEGVMSALLDRFDLSALISTGFGGATSEGCQAGDIVLCPAVSRAREGPGPAGWTRGTAVRSDDRLIARAVDVLRKEDIRFHLGDGLTVARLIDDPCTKETLGRTLQAKVVDMEGYWIAREARGRVERILLTRAISDPMGQPLPRLSRHLVGQQEVEYRQMALQVLTHPLQAAAIFRLAECARLAARNLAAFLSAFVSGS